MEKRYYHCSHGANKIVGQEKFNNLTFLSMKSVRIIYRNSFPTAQKTCCVSVMKTNQLMLFREIIAIFENHMKYIVHSVSDMNGFLNVKAGGTYIVTSLL